MHRGGPAALGIAGRDRRGGRDRVEREPDGSPVSGTCGVTRRAAVTASRVPFAITHTPGHMVLTDARDEQYRVS